MSPVNCRAARHTSSGTTPDMSCTAVTSPDASSVVVSVPSTMVTV